MSLTATLLFNQPIRLPRGRHRLISSEGEVNTKRARNSTTYLANVEIVYNAIADGCTTIYDIEIVTDISRVTLWKALRELEAWPDGPRIVRIIAGKHQPHKFQIVAPDKGV